MKSLVAAIVLSVGALVASQAHAYTINDYNSVVAQLNSAQEGLAYSEQQSYDAYAAQQNEYQIYISNIVSCGQVGPNNQSAYLDCVDGYIAEYESNMANHQSTIMFYEAEAQSFREQIADLTQLRNEIASILGIG